ncbi:MAG: polymerase sigma-70 factor, subfamily [Frankiales bacterium]|nr:polymerase sigma-70 factor, subfamily [Frankiales bacterium]
MGTADELERSFALLYRRCAADVLRFARRRLTDEDAAWDVVSDTFLTAWRHASRCPDRPEEQLPWLYAIAGNAVRTSQRSRNRRLRLQGRADAMEPPPMSADLADGVAANELIRLALSHVSEVDRELLRLVAWEGLSDSISLAIALGISPSAAAVRLHRARRRLRSQLELLGAEQPEPEITPRPSRSITRSNP